MKVKICLSGRSTKKIDNSDDDISDEEKFLDALEKGNLNSYGDIGKKDPSLLTARQVRLVVNDDSLQYLAASLISMTNIFLIK